MLFHPGARANGPDLRTLSGARDHVNEQIVNFKQSNPEFPQGFFKPYDHRCLKVRISQTLDPDLHPFPQRKTFLLGRTAGQLQKDGDFFENDRRNANEAKRDNYKRD
jgi:hypothetical protein